MLLKSVTPSFNQEGALETNASTNAAGVGTLVDLSERCKQMGLNECKNSIPSESAARFIPKPRGFSLCVPK